MSLICLCLCAKIAEEKNEGDINYDKKKSITDKAVVSTSIDHGVAACFGTGSYHTVLEIYAPAHLTDGAFIKSFSQYPYEQEILLDSNQSYKVLDAGVRIKSVTDFSENTEQVTERYIKLMIVDN